MNRIERLIKEYCSEGVEYKNIGSTCNIKTGRGVTKKDSSINGLYPIISGGIEPMGFYNEYNRLDKTVTISRVGANAGYVNYINSKFYLNDKCFSIIPKEKFKLNINTKYLYYILKNIESKITELQSEGGVPTINTTKVASINIPLPPFPIQLEIVNILDKFSQLTIELEAELDVRRKQYEYYRNKLLAFTPPPHRITDRQSASCIKWVKLGELGKFIRGNGLQKKDFRDTGIGCIHYGQIYTYYGIFVYKTISFVSKELALKLQVVKKNDLIITLTSENLEDVCRTIVWFGDEEIVTGAHATIFKHNQNSKYLAYYFQTDNIHKQKRRYARGAKVIEIKTSDIAKFIIPIPSLPEQERIATILDRFEALVNVEIPAEIIARRKQYEYYRNKLLTFAEYE